MVSNIQRFSLHDGPGIRTTVFLKGCNAKCQWCHNPESMDRLPALQFIEERCIGCRACLEVCQQGVHQVVEGKHVLRRELCERCGECARHCYARALTLVGEEMTVEQVLEEVRRDTPYYDNSNGGVTLSGGEPLVQHRFTRELLKRCRAENLHTAIETNLLVPWERIEEVLPFLDIVIFDVKTFDDALHKEWVGVSSVRALENVRRLATVENALIARTPIIPQVNDSKSQIGAISDSIKDLPNLMYYELLSFNPLGMDKYRWLGWECSLAGRKRQKMDEMMPLADEAMRRGIRIQINGVNMA